jgi:hypothetical protein
LDAIKAVNHLADDATIAEELAIRYADSLRRTHRGAGVGEYGPTREALQYATGEKDVHHDHLLIRNLSVGSGTASLRQ